MHSTHLSYFSRMSEASVFADQASVETRRRGVAEAAQVCAVMDGAEWIDGSWIFSARTRCAFSTSPMRPRR